MTHGIRTALRDAVSLRTLLAYATILAMLGWYFGTGIDTLLGICLGFLALELLDVATETRAVDRDLATLVVAVLGGAVMVGLVVVEGPRLVYLVLLVAAGWLALDGIVNRRIGGSAADPDVDRHPHADSWSCVDGERDDVLLRLGAQREIVETLKDGPKTVDEIADDANLTVSRVERALAFLVSEGAVERDGNCYALDESAFGPIPFVLNLVTSVAGGLLRRFTRPFRLLAAR
ncbi:hypothetical protein GCM10028857_20280 [Salinarchaeum chitinilyticum]